jgi:gliding motility-associated-like protein
VASQTILPVTNWNLLDCDNDGLLNGDEIAANTDSFNPDSDGDGVIDGTEVSDATNPLEPCSFVLANQTVVTSLAWNNLDCDLDDLPNSEEIIIGTNPLNPDTDGDGVKDSQEVTDNTSPTNPCSFILSSQTLVPTVAWNQQDCDTDGLTNEEEANTGTNPTNPDTDGDGVIDGTEITDATNPLEACSFILTSQTLTPSLAWNTLDCDEDGLTNEEEITGGTNPTNTDTDGDGVIDGTEISDLTDPLVPCNFILASQTVTPNVAWNSLDCDEDGLTNEEEITGGSNPLNGCDPTNSGPNCQDTVLIQIPEIFTPNNDGINETFEIPGLEDYPNNSIQIFNRWGSTVLNAAPYENNWNGNSTSNLILGEGELPTGTYYYILDLNGDGSIIYKGYVYLKR